MKCRKAVCFKIIIAIFLCTGQMAAASEKDNDQNTSIKELQRETMDTIQAVKKYSSEQKEKAVTRAESALEMIDEQIDQLQDKLDEKWDKMDRVSRDKIKSALKNLRNKRNEVSEWYGGLKYSSANAWDEVKRGFIESYKTMSESFEKARENFENSN